MMQRRVGGLTALAEPLGDARTRALLLAFLVSEMGDGITSVVVPLTVYASSGSVPLLASTFAGRLLLGSLLSTLGGTIADRWSRRSLLLSSYAARAALVVALLALEPFGGWGFALVGVLVGALGALDTPAAEALLRDAFRSNLRALAVARKSARNVSSLVGPAVGALLIGVGGSQTALLTDAATFVVALGIIASSARGLRVAGAEATEDASLNNGHAVERLRGLPQVVTSSPIIPLAFTSSVLGSIAVAAATVLAVPYLRGLPGSPRGAYGYALSAYSVGATIGLLLAGMYRGKAKVAPLLAYSCLAYGGVCMLSVATDWWWVLAFSWFAWGICYGPEDVIVDAEVVRSVPAAMLGRVYGVWATMGKIGAGAAYAMVPVASAWATPRQFLFSVGLLYAAVGPLLILVVRYRVLRRSRRARRPLRAPERGS